MSKEASVNMAEDTKEISESQFNLDGILSELGSFGKYQLLLLFLLAFRDSFLAMCNFHYVFTAAEVAYRCHVPECEDRAIGFNSSWTAYTIANHTNQCYRMSPLQGPPLNITEENRQWFARHADSQFERCSPDNFAADKVVPCKKLVYEDYNSIVAEALGSVDSAGVIKMGSFLTTTTARIADVTQNATLEIDRYITSLFTAIMQFDLGCQPWKRTMIGTVHNLGLVFSFVLCGFVSDRYGRKVIIVGSPLVVGVAGLVKSFSVNYWMLLVLEFLETALGYGNASMVLSLETVTQKRRVVYSCLWDILSSLGSACFGLIAWRVPYWRHLMRAIYAPLLVVLLYIFLVDEGVRWLLAHNKKDEAVKVLNKVAKINNITLSRKAKAMLDHISGERKSCEVGQAPPVSKANLLSDLRSRTIMLRVVLIAACFACSTFVLNGTIINSTSISGNKYINFSAMLLVSVPTRIITALTLTRFGRKAPICVAYTLCAVFFITSAFVPKSIWWASVLFYLTGKMCSSYGVFSLWVVAFEVFPTTSRNSLTNLASTVGRIGSVLAPQTPLLDKLMSGLPSIVFGLVALGPAFLALLLPDTSRTPLPDDITDAENIDKMPADGDDVEGSDVFAVAVVTPPGDLPSAMVRSRTSAT